MPSTISFYDDGYGRVINVSFQRNSVFGMRNDPRGTTHQEHLRRPSSLSFRADHLGHPTLRQMFMFLGTMTLRASTYDIYLEVDRFDSFAFDVEIKSNKIMTIVDR